MQGTPLFPRERTSFDSILEFDAKRGTGGDNLSRLVDVASRIPDQEAELVRNYGNQVDYLASAAVYTRAATRLHPILDSLHGHDMKEIFETAAVLLSMAAGMRNTGAKFHIASPLPHHYSMAAVFRAVKRIEERPVVHVSNMTATRRLAIEELVERETEELVEATTFNYRIKDMEDSPVYSVTVPKVFGALLKFQGGREFFEMLTTRSRTIYKWCNVDDDIQAYLMSFCTRYKLDPMKIEGKLYLKAEKKTLSIDVDNMLQLFDCNQVVSRLHAIDEYIKGWFLKHPLPPTWAKVKLFEHLITHFGNEHDFEIREQIRAVQKYWTEMADRQMLALERFLIFLRNDREKAIKWMTGEIVPKFFTGAGNNVSVRGGEELKVLEHHRELRGVTKGKEWEVSTLSYNMFSGINGHVVRDGLVTADKYHRALQGVDRSDQWKAVAIGVSSKNHWMKEVCEKFSYVRFIDKEVYPHAYPTNASFERRDLFTIDAIADHYDVIVDDSFIADENEKKLKYFYELVLKRKGTSRPIQMIVTKLHRDGKFITDGLKNLAFLYNKVEIKTGRPHNSEEIWIFSQPLCDEVADKAGHLEQIVKQRIQLSALARTISSMRTLLHLYGQVHRSVFGYIDHVIREDGEYFGDDQPDGYIAKWGRSINDEYPMPSKEMLERIRKKGVHHKEEGQGE